MNRVAALAVIVALVGPSASAPSTDPPDRDARSRGGVVRVEHRDPAAMPARGPTTALVTIELFFSPGQSSRGKVYSLIEKLQSSHPSRIRLIYRVIGVGARLPRAALQAHASGKFFAFMDVLNGASQTLTDKQIIELGEKVGLDPDRLQAAMTKPPPGYEQVLEANERRRKQRIRGNPPLPNVLFNGRVPQSPISTLGTSDLEREYRAARELAEDLLDRGVHPHGLAQAFDQIPPVQPQEIIVQPSATDGGEDVPEARLASPPLDLRGLPSYGTADAAMTIAVLCSPTSSNCVAPMRVARDTRDLYPDQVRVVWAPYFDIGRDEAADLSLLADAALCAEKVGITLEDRDDSFGGDASPGWRWVEAVLAESTRRQVAPERVIDKVADKLRVDRRAFATCRAQLAGTTVGWIEAARHAGVTVTPNTVVGGRIYGPLVDRSTLQLLVEAELAPGWLAPTWTRDD